MKLNDYMEDLAQLPLFEDFRRDDLRNHLMERGTALHRYLKNEMIYLQGQTASRMDIVLSGKVSVQRLDENGNVLRIEDFRKGSLIGANLIFSTFRTYPMTVVSEGNSASFLGCATDSEAVHTEQGLHGAVSQGGLRSHTCAHK